MYQFKGGVQMKIPIRFIKYLKAKAEKSAKRKCFKKYNNIIPDNFNMDKVLDDDYKKEMKVI